MTIQSLYAEISHGKFHFVLEDSLYSLKRHLGPHDIHVLGISIDHWGDVEEPDSNELYSIEVQTERISKYNLISGDLEERACSEFATVHCYVYGEAGSANELQVKIARLLDFAHCRFEEIGSCVWNARVEYTLAYEEPDPNQIVSDAIAQIGMTCELIELKEQTESELSEDVLDSLKSLSLPDVPSDHLTRVLPTVVCNVTGTARDDFELSRVLRDLLHEASFQLLTISPLRNVSPLERKTEDSSST